MKRFISSLKHVYHLHGKGIGQSTEDFFYASCDSTPLSYPGYIRFCGLPVAFLKYSDFYFLNTDFFYLFQVVLSKFVRQMGDLLPSTIYIPYLKMLRGLASGPQCAHYCFSLLKVNGSSHGKKSDTSALSQLFRKVQRLI